MPDEIMTKLDDALSGIKEAQDLSKANADKLNALDEEKFQKIADDVTKNLDEVNTLKAKQDAIEESVKSFEKKMCRPEGGASEVSDKSKEAFVKYLRRGGKLEENVYTEIADSIVAKSLKGASQHEAEIFAKSLVVGNNEDGGYWVRPEVADFMIKRIFETSPMRQISNVVTIGSEAIEIPIDDNESTAEWVGEVDARADTATPKVGLLTIHAHEQSADPLVSQKMLDDAGFDVEGWLQTKTSDRFARAENTAFVVGDGSKRPRGFLTYDAWTTAGTYERGKIEQRNSGGSGTFTADNLIDLQTDLVEAYQANAAWVMQRKTFAEVMKKKAATTGEYLLNFQMLAQGAPLVLLGKPVVFFDNMPTVAANSLSIAYGDFKSGYTIVDRIGIRILRDPYTSKPFVKYYTTKRTGGDVTNYQSIKILKLST